MEMKGWMQKGGHSYVQIKRVVDYKVEMKGSMEKVAL